MRFREIKKRCRAAHFLILSLIWVAMNAYRFRKSADFSFAARFY
jgi:hypothetical protein